MKLEVRNEKDVTVIVPVGSLVIGPPEEVLKEAIPRLLVEGRTHLVIDLGEAKKIDSSGIETLLLACQRARQAGGDVKLRNLEGDPRCSLLVFETVPPFRGIEVAGTPELIDGDVTEARAAIAGRYLGAAAGDRFARTRKKPGVLLRLRAERPRVWDLAAILPTDGS